MANYFEPQSTIYLLKGVPLDTTYNHTWYFSRPDYQYKDIVGDNNYTKKTFTKSQYQRYDNNSINIGISTTELFGYNYMVFSNGETYTFEGNSYTRRYYCFITDIEYVNANTTRVYYEIDYMQTFMFDYVLGDSFVVREHSATDGIGDNIIDEGFPSLKYELGQTTPDFPTTDNWYIVLVSKEEIDTQDLFLFSGVIPDGIISGQYTGFKSYTFKIPKIIDSIGSGKTPIQYMTEFIKVIKKYINNPEIAQVYMLPNWALDFDSVVRTTEEGATEEERFYTLQPFCVYKEFNCDNFQTSWRNGWKPKNKKLYTFPYNKLTLYSSDGSNKDFSYEHIDNKFVILTTSVGTGTMYCFPNLLYGARGITNGINLKLGTSAGFTRSSYEDWLRNGALSTIGNSIISGVSTGVMAGVVTGNTVGAVVGAGSSVFSNIVNAIQQSQKVDTLSGNITPSIFQGLGGVTDIKPVNDSGLYQYAENLQTFFTINQRVVEEIAVQIDDYFTMFGYATNRVKTPYRHARRGWTYTQTNGCVFKQINLPQKFANKIASIYDKGITFWDFNSTIGDYSKTNTPLGSEVV